MTDKRHDSTGAIPIEKRRNGTFVERLARQHEVLRHPPATGGRIATSSLSFSGASPLTCVRLSANAVDPALCAIFGNDAQTWAYASETVAPSGRSAT
ncbi:MAG TPA: hypothetical protein VID24_01345 [Candidatus Eremiobacteraceae bacterium]